MCYVDWDTPLYKAASKTQTNFILCTDKTTGEKYRFSGVREFYGNSNKKKDGGWIAEQNKERAETDQSLISAEDYIIEECAELSGTIEEVLEVAMETLDYAVGRIKKHSNAEDYKLCIGGEGNWRYNAAHILPYKGNRKEKPILFMELKEAFIEKYKNKVIIVDGQEVDDYLGQIGWQNYLNFRKTGKYDNILSYVDKDLKMIISPHFNYDKPEDGIEIPTPEDAARWFCTQLLTGDKGTDNIQGLPNLSSDFQERYGLRKCRGVGKATAFQLLEGKPIKECFEVVVEAYKCYYGEDKKDFVSFRGERFKWNWLDYLKENGLLLWMRRYPDEMYDIEDTLKRLGVVY